jgi:outer membrane protein assembly factor BamB
VWGSEASTPLIVGDTLYVGADNPERVVLAALDKMTGAVRWTVKAESARSRELAAPASLTYQVVDGVPQVIVATYGSREVLGVHAERGEIMWRYPYPAEIILGLISTPVAVGNRLLISGGEGKGRNFFACLEMSAKDEAAATKVGQAPRDQPDSTDSTAAGSEPVPFSRSRGAIGYRELYRSTELQTNMYNTVAVYNDAVFGFGGGQRLGFLQCTNLADGRLLWSEESEDWTKDQQLVVADGLLLAVTKGGELVLAEASRERYQELARFRLDLEVGRPQQPTIANGRLYIRGSREIACYQIAP